MTFNQTQKTIILIAIFCVVAMAVYPPWVLKGLYPLIHPPRIVAGPYSFIWSPPKDACFVDLYRLSIQFGCILVTTIGLCLVCRTQKN